MTVQKIITNTSYTYWLPCITEELLDLQMYHYHIACCSCQSKLKDTLLTCYSRYDHVTSFKHNLAGKEMLFVHRCPFFISQLHGIFSYDIYKYKNFKVWSKFHGRFCSQLSSVEAFESEFNFTQVHSFFFLLFAWSTRLDVSTSIFFHKSTIFFFAQSSQTVIKCWTKISGAL